MIRLCAFADEAAISLKEQIFELKKHDIDLLELRSIDQKNVSEFTDEEAKLYAKELKDSGITVWSIGSPLGKVDISNADEHLEAVRRICEIAKIFEAKRIRMFSFYNAYEKPEEVFSAIEKMSTIASEYELILCHENEKEIYGDTLPRIHELINRNIENLRFVFDPANFIQCGVNTTQAITELFDKTYYFHIKDVIASTGEIVPAGYGDGRISELIARIPENVDKTLTLEPHLKVFGGYSEIDATEMKNKFTFDSNDAAFDAAASALKDLLIKQGYSKALGGYKK